MAELERDIFYQNVENAGAMRPGKANLEIINPLLRSSFAVRVVCEIYYETNGILAQKNHRVGEFNKKLSVRVLYRTAIFFRCQVSRN
jgi:hypothetical protein